MSEQISELQLRVITYKLDDPDNVEFERVINYANPSDRKWLGSHSWWAFTNGRGIEQEPA